MEEGFVRSHASRPRTEQGALVVWYGGAFLEIPGFDEPAEDPTQQE